MIPNNNLSVLPWYTSIEQQNARKWWAYGRIYPLFTPAMFLLPFQILREHHAGTTIVAFKVYKANGTLVGDYTQGLTDAGATILQYTDYDVILYSGAFPVFMQFPEGQYYCSLRDQYTTYYSEVFTVINGSTNYLKIEWWDTEDLIMDAGRIVYKYAYGTQYKNALYLCADLAKPEYIFEEEGETRDGYFFPIKQISEKRYHFQFLASEYLLDVMRFIRMADYAQITYQGQVYSLDTFLLTPEWEGDGDVASVEAEFDTATVAKKIGLGYIKMGGGDFNIDYNEDYLID